jgi:hypothetical protein
MTERKLLVGKVADILGEYELAINIGKNSGVKQGMEFAVLGKKLITDPDSHKTLGTYNYDKIRVRVTQVEDNYSVASTKSTPFISFDLVFPASQPKLKSDKLLTLEELDRNVSVGDIVEERR